MTRPVLSVALTETDRTRALILGRIMPDGVDLRITVDEPQPIFRAAQQRAAPDIAELSLGTHILQTDQRSAKYLALPIFLSRSFRHNAIHLDADSTLTALDGCRIGMQGLQQTATIWMRGILAEHYGLDRGAVDWVVGGLDAPGNPERSPLGRAPCLPIRHCDPDETLAQMLADGRLDAILSPNPPKGIAVRGLFSDTAAEEQAFYRRSGLFPIMHVLGVRRDRLQEFPGLGRALFDAFCAAKAGAQADLQRRNYLRASLPWIADAARQTRDLMGSNPWSYGFSRNRSCIQAVIRYAEDDGLIAPGLAPEALFWPESVDWPDPEDDLVS